MPFPRPIDSTLHGATDYSVGTLLATAFPKLAGIDGTRAAKQFVTGQWKKGRRQWVPHVGLCLFELSALLLSDPTQKGDFHGDVDAVRAANTEDPHRKIHSGPRAVQPAAA